MLVSARQACVILAEAGVARTQGRRVLLAGLAGRPTQTSSALLYDEEQVRALAARPVLTPGEVLRACPHGLFVAAGAEIVDVTPERRDARTSRLELIPPGAWFDQLHRHRFDTGPGQSWLIWPNQSWVVADRAPTRLAARTADQRGTSAQ